MAVLLLFKGKTEDIVRGLEDPGEMELEFTGGRGWMNGEKYVPG